MKLTATTCYAPRQGGIAHVLEVFRAAGMDGVDLSLSTEGDEWQTDTAAFLARVRESGLYVGQAHAPIHWARWGDPDYTAAHLPVAEEAIRVAGAAGASCIVFHPRACPGLSSEEELAWNVELYYRLGQIGRAAGTKICLENLWAKDTHEPCLSARELNLYYDTLADPAAFTCCADVGHYLFAGHDPAASIREMGRRLGALHVHDNDGRFDQHLFPYLGGVNWSDFTRALAEIGYEGDFDMELVPLNKHFPPEAFADGVKLMVTLGRHLIGMVESARRSLGR